MKDVSLTEFIGQRVVLNIFLVLTPVFALRLCASSTKNSQFWKMPLCSALKARFGFAMKRFCGAEGIDKTITLSDFRNPNFGKPVWRWIDWW